LISFNDYVSGFVSNIGDTYDTSIVLGLIVMIHYSSFIAHDIADNDTFANNITDADTTPDTDTDTDTASFSQQTSRDSVLSMSVLLLWYRCFQFCV